jgi:hypothetical protein
VRARLPALLILAGLLALPGLASAAGKVSFLPTFVLFGEWTDNLLLTPENDPVDDKIAAYSASFQPGLRVRYDTYRAETFVFFAATFRHVFEHEEHDGWPEYYSGGVGWSYWLSPRWRWTIGDEFIFATDPRDQPFSEGSDLETLRTESIGNRLFTRLQWNQTQITSVETGYAFATTEYRDPLILDTVEHQFDIQWARQIDPSSRFFTFYNYNRALFSPDYDFLRHWWDNDVSMDPSLPTALENDADFDTHIPGVGLQLFATPRLSFEARSGIILPAYEKNGIYQLDDLDWYQRLEVSQAFWRMQATGIYQRTFAPAHGLEGGVVTNAVSARLDERWLRDLETYQEAAFANYVQPATDINAWRATAAINYYIFSWFGVGAGYNYLEQISYDADGGTNAVVVAHRVTVRLGLTSPRPDWLSF